MNKTSFTIKVLKKISYSWNIFGFSISDTLIFFTKNTVRIVAIMSFALSLIRTIRGGKIKIAISRITQTMKVSPTILGRPGKIILSRIKLSEVWSVFTVSSNILIDLVVKLRERWGQTIKTGKIVMAFVFTLATLKRLSVTDPQTLSTLDVLTLNDLDYTVS